MRAKDMEVMFPVELTLCSASGSCFLSLGGNRTAQVMMACGAKTEKFNGNLGKRGHLLLLNTTLMMFSLMGKNTSLWFHYVKHHQDKDLLMNVHL